MLPADPEGFWAGFANELEWMRRWDAVLEWRPPYAKWFVGGQLNVSANCLDRHIRTAANKAAFIWEGEPGDRRFLGHLDLTGAMLPAKVARYTKDAQNRTTEYFRDEWLALKAKLYDGNILRLSAIQRTKTTPVVLEAQPNQRQDENEAR